MKQVGEGRELLLRETEAGLVVGPCAMPGDSESKYWFKGPCIVPSHSESTYWIRLNGEGPSYSPAEFDFVDAKGVVLPKDPDLEGEIRVDQAHHRVLVNLRVRGDALMLNGSYRLEVGE